MTEVRTTRVRIIHLRNDHKAVMEHLERGIHAHFASLQNTPDARPNTNGASSAPHAQPTAQPAATASATPGAAFAKVNTVVPGSPADQAGLKAGDVIRSFGNVNWLNHERLSKVAETVQQNEGVR
jgi:26S proteasome non-ATPase regulatory subunit 9